MSIRFDGFDDAIRAIQGLGEIAGREVQVGALKAAARPLAEEMGRRCPRDSGMTAEDFTVAEGRDSKAGEGTATVLVGARTGKRGRAFIAYWIEFGVPAHHIAARPFIRPAYDQGRGQITGDYVQGIQPAYQRIVRKYSR